MVKSLNESDLDWLLKWLKREIEVLERSEMYKEKKSSKEEGTGKGGKEKWFTASVLHATSPLKSSGCVFYMRRNHNSKKCFKFLALDGQQRYDKLKELGVCFRCLNSGHRSRNCKAKCCVQSAKVTTIVQCVELS